MRHARTLKASAWLWPALLVLLAAGIWMLPWEGWVVPLRQWVESHGAMGWVVFVLAYAGVVVLPLPAAAMSVAGGLAFGWWGVPLSLLGSLVGCVLPWWATRRWLRGPMLRRFDGPRVAAADRAVRRNGFLFVALLRVTPILPFTLQNYLLGLTGVRIGPYLAATLVGLAPGTLAMVWVGEMGGLAAAGADRAKLVVAAGGLTLLGLLILVMIRRARVELRRAGFDGA
ncbi:TVP38/TMEM64 family protein [Jannaschia sp. W003]|uniref:TVP38/TMEM64 family protein n=1 Tax=Jannaschia sp. W003 TaxID=2867012 RepID=UPI0021A81907|nr:VTT domain-containing protein [Jannaschia sp. W003]UWQ20219.1 VTT domain-containing protein [Jannaschia sp. W003]